MNFKEYEDAAAVLGFYPDVGKGTQIALAYTALGLVGEGGEYSEKVKKYIRDGKFNRLDAIKELGDVLWYLTMCAKECGYSLEEVASINLAKLQDRNERGVQSGSGDNR